MVQFELDCNDGKGNAYACHSVAEFHAVINDDHARAAAVLAKNCDGNNKYGASCFKLGRLLLAGRGVEANDAKAMARFEQACNSGISQGCYHLGMMLLEGTVKKDPPRAMACFDKACTEGDAESCFHVGQRWLAPGGPGHGLGARDPAKALAPLEVACGHGHAPSCRLLAVLFKNGDGPVAPDAAKFEMYKKHTEELVMQRGAQMGVRVT